MNLKTLWIGLVVGGIIGGMIGCAGSGVSQQAAASSVVSISKEERMLGEPLYADILLTVYVAHKVGRDRDIWNGIGEIGKELAR